MVFNGSNKVNNGILMDTKMNNIEYQPYIRTESNLTVSNNLNEKTHQNNNTTIFRPKIVFTHIPNHPNSIKLPYNLMTKQTINCLVKT
jgi:hypothetical protein